MPLPDANNYSTRIYELLKETDLQNLSYSQFQQTAETLFIEPENEDEMRRLVLVQLARMAVRGDWDGFLTGAGSSAVTSLVAGTNVTLSPITGLGDVTINAAGASGAPSTAEYVTLATDATLTNERVLTAGAGVSLTDAGAGLTATIANTGVLAAFGGVGITTNTVGGNATITNAGVTSNVAGTGIVLSATTGAVTINAPLLGDLILPEYVTLATDTQLQNERVLTAGTGITLTDAGAGSTVTIAATGGGGGVNPLSFSSSQNLAVTAYWLLGLNPSYASAMDNEAYTTSFTGFIVKFQPPMTGTSGITMGISVAAAADTNYMWIYDEDAKGWAGTFVGKIKMPTTTTGLQSETQWLDAAGSNITSPTFTQGNTYIAVLEIASNFSAASGRQANIPFVMIANEGAFTAPTGENYNYQYTGTIDASLPTTDINFFGSATGWPMIGLAL